MRVLWIVGLVPNKVGGIERLCVQLAQQNRADGIDTHFVFEDSPCTALATQLAAHGAVSHIVRESACSAGSRTWRSGESCARRARTSFICTCANSSACFLCWWASCAYPLSRLTTTPVIQYTRAVCGGC